MGEHCVPPMLYLLLWSYLKQIRRIQWLLLFHRTQQFQILNGYFLLLIFFPLLCASLDFLIALFIRLFKFGQEQAYTKEVYDKVVAPFKNADYDNIVNLPEYLNWTKPLLQEFKKLNQLLWRI